MTPSSPLSTLADRPLILVTGAAQRIGAALARDLAHNGWHVIIHYRSSRQAAESLARDIRDTGGKADIIQADLESETESQGLIGRINNQFGRLSALINNASTFELDSPDTATRESWDMHMEANLRAPFVLMQHFQKQLPEGMDGNIINIIDQRVWNLTPYFTTYTLSKAGLWALTQTMAMALAPRIRVNAIGPGPTLPSSRQSMSDFRAQFDAVPLRKPTELVEICRAVLYILSAGSMTGQMIALDGGEHLGWAQGGNSAPPHE